MAGHITQLKDKNNKPIKRKDGSNVWRARYPDPLKGGTAQIEKRFRTKSEAERWLARAGVAVQDGTHIGRAKAETRFADVADAWRETWADLEPKTRAGYENILKKHVMPRYGKAKVSAIDAAAIQRHVNELATERLPATPRHPNGRHRSPNTVRRIYGVVRSVLRVAVERGHIRSNPCDAVRLPKGVAGHNRPIDEEVGSDEKLFLTPAQVRALAEGVPARYRVAVYVAAYCGLRAGEQWALRRRDIDLLHGELHVTRALKDINSSAESMAADKGLLIGPTKTGKRRKMKLPAFLIPLLTDHLALDSPGGNGPDDLLFPSPTGKPQRHGNFYRTVFRPTVTRRSCNECGARVTVKAERCPTDGCASEAFSYLLPERLHKLRWHDLRHTCASLSLAVSPDLYIVMRRLGHRDIQTTINIYGHMLPSVDAALATGLDALHAGAGDSAHVVAIGTARAK